MRLTLLSHFIGRGGSTAFFIQLRDFFEESGHEVALVTGHDASDPMATNYRVVPGSANQGWRDRMREYVRVVQETSPDVVYTISGREEFEVLRFLAMPRALHCLCIEQHEYADLPLWHRQLEPYTELRTTHTPDLLEKVKGSSNCGIELAHAPYRLPLVFLRAPDVRERLRSRNSVRTEVCFLSRLEKFQKRAHWLPEIMVRCREQGADLSWHIYGTGPAEPELRDAVAKAGLADQVIFHGWQGPAALAEQLGQHDIFFLCSRWEGLPAAMAEAMLCGLACVVPNVPAGMTYMVKDGGGWTYDAASPAASAEALRRAVVDKEALQRKRVEAQAIARSLHDPAVVDGHLHRVENLLSRLKFNGRVAELDSARPMRLVTWPVLFRRRWRSLRERIWPMRSRDTISPD